jgi:hypothetical protein
MVKITGYIILAISCLLFLMILFVPFLDLSKGQMAGLTTGLIIAGEVLFYLSLILLGRTFFEKIKSRFKLRKSKLSESNLPDENNDPQHP